MRTQELEFIGPVGIQTLTFACKPALVGSASLVIIFSTLICWSIFAPLASAVLVVGNVIVEGKVKSVQTFDPGVVKELAVQDGDFVKQGQVVARFDSTQDVQSRDSLERLLVLDEAVKARIRSELAGSPSISFPIRADEVRLSDYPDVLEDQQNAMRIRQKGIQLRVSELNNEKQSDYSALEMLNEQEKELRFRLSLVQADIAINTELLKSGAGTARALRESYSAASSLRAELSDLKTHQMEVERQIRQFSIEIERIEISTKEQDEEELYRISADEQETVERLSRARLAIARSEIKSPISGRVINLFVHTIGGVVAPGATLMEIVPSNTKLIIEARVRPVDVSGIAVGSTVIVRPEGAEAQRLPELKGRLTSISADRIQESATSEPYFLVTADIDPLAFHRNFGRSLRPGISLDLMMRKPDSTLLEYLLSPLLHAWTHAMRY